MVKDAKDDALPVVMVESEAWRRSMEGVALGAVIVLAVGVYLLVGLGWALITLGALTAAWSLVIVDVPTRPVYTGPRAPRPERG